jgi:hypothetical protein
MSLNSYLKKREKLKEVNTLHTKTHRPSNKLEEYIVSSDENIEVFF